MSLREFLETFTVNSEFVNILTSNYISAFGYGAYAYDFLHDVDDPDGYLDVKVLYVHALDGGLLEIIIDVVKEVSYDEH